MTEIREDEVALTHKIVPPPLPASVSEALCDILSNGQDIHRCAAAQALGNTGDGAALDALTGALLDTDEDVRADAAAALGKIADRRAVAPMLENLIGDPSFDVKMAVIESLTKMKAAELEPLLGRLLSGRDDDEIAWDEEAFYQDGWDDWLDIQLAALKAIGALGATDTIPQILNLLDDEMAQDVTAQAYGILAQLGEKGSTALQDLLKRESVRNRRRIARAVAESNSSRNLEIMAQCLGDPEADVRMAAIDSLLARDPQNDALIPLLQDADAGIRARLIDKIGHSHPDQIALLLWDSVPSVRLATIKLICRHADLLPRETALAPVTEILNSGGTAELMAAAMECYGVLDPEAAFELIAKTVADEDTALPVRRAALRALAVNGTKAIPVLAGIVGDKTRQIRLDALSAIAKIADSEADADGIARQTLLAALRGELIDAPEPQTDPNSEAADAKESEAEIAENTARETKAEAAPAEEAEAADESDPADAGDAPELTEVQAEAPAPDSTLAAISRNAREEVAREMEIEPDPVELDDGDLEFLEIARTRAMAKRKTDPDGDHIAPYQDVRNFAAALLSNLGGDDIIDGLTAALEGSDKELTLAIVDSLARQAERRDHMPGPALQALKDLSDDADRNIRILTVRALGAAKDSTVTDLLAEKSSDVDSFVRIEVAQGLGRLNSGASVLIHLTADSNPAVRLAAATALCKTGTENLGRRLIEFGLSEEGYHRKEAGKLLGAVDPAPVNKQLVDALLDQTKKREWIVYLEMLNELNGRDRRLAQHENII